jgi:hypothetical protein
MSSVTSSLEYAVMEKPSEEIKYIENSKAVAPTEREKCQPECVRRLFRELLRVAICGNISINPNKKRKAKRRRGHCSGSDDRADDGSVDKPGEIDIKPLMSAIIGAINDMTLTAILPSLNPTFIEYVLSGTVLVNVVQFMELCIEEKCPLWVQATLVKTLCKAVCDIDLPNNKILVLRNRLAVLILIIKRCMLELAGDVESMESIFKLLRHFYQRAASIMKSEDNEEQEQEVDSDLVLVRSDGWHL